MTMEERAARIVAAFKRGDVTEFELPYIVLNCLSTGCGSHILEQLGPESRSKTMDGIQDWANNTEGFMLFSVGTIGFDPAASQQVLAWIENCRNGVFEKIRLQALRKVDLDDPNDPCVRHN